MVFTKISSDLQKYLGHEKERNPDTHSETRSTGVAGSAQCWHAGEDVGSQVIPQSAGVNINWFSYSVG